eukprot:scaffold2067_cov379-Prasinococcus_capsulatus_cf.AAC.4
MDPSRGKHSRHAVDCNCHCFARLRVLRLRHHQSVAANHYIASNCYSAAIASFSVCIRLARVLSEQHSGSVMCHAQVFHWPLSLSADYSFAD